MCQVNVLYTTIPIMNSLWTYQCIIIVILIMCLLMNNWARDVYLYDYYLVSDLKLNVYCNVWCANLLIRPTGEEGFDLHFYNQVYIMPLLLFSSCLCMMMCGHYVKYAKKNNTYISTHSTTYNATQQTTTNTTQHHTLQHSTAQHSTTEHYTMTPTRTI